MGKIIVDDREPEYIKKIASQHNEQELNKKLAEWAGFKYQKPKLIRRALTSKGVAPVYKLEGWIKPDGKRSTTPFNPPNFTQSLDACFKWLVPKLGVWSLSTWEYRIPHAHITDKETGKTANVGNKSPALALCLAIEKLIDTEQSVTASL